MFTAPNSLGWDYDKNGNRTVETRNASNLSYVYSPPGSNWLYQRGSDTRIKSPNGNTVSSAAGSFAYDGYNRLVTAQTASETTTYTYNALGQRIRKSNQHGLTTSFHYSPDGELLYEQDARGNTKAYVWLDGRPLARIDNDAQIYYYHVDHLGAPQAMTDAAGKTVWKGYYDPFGKATVRGSRIENNLRLPGQYYDRETGLHYNYFRDYDPGTGRYIEADPIGLEGGINLYLYANAAPTMYSDPLGLKPVPCGDGSLGCDDGLLDPNGLEKDPCISPECRMFDENYNCKCVNDCVEKWEKRLCRYALGGRGTIKPICRITAGLICTSRCKGKCDKTSCEK